MQHQCHGCGRQLKIHRHGKRRACSARCGRIVEQRRKAEANRQRSMRRSEQGAAASQTRAQSVRFAVTY